MNNEPPQIAPMIDAVTRDVLSMMTGSQIESSSNEPAPESFDVDGVAAVVGMTGGLTANVHLVLGGNVARKVVGGMLGSSQFGDAEMRDAVGELTNMTFIRGREMRITSQGFTFGAMNSFRLAGSDEPVRVIVFARMNS
jgi:CheY-specific phosphatase CheX